MSERAPVQEVVVGDCLDVLRTIQDDSVDAVVTDPPAGIEFMGKAWDRFDEREVNPSGAQTNEWDASGGAGGTRPFARGPTPRYQGKTKASLLPFQDFIAEVFAEVLRVLKPGGHALVWAIPRTSHHTAMGLERAGFEIRDVVMHLFGSGFPKSLSVAKASLDRVQSRHGSGTCLCVDEGDGFLAREDARRQGGSTDRVLRERSEGSTAATGDTIVSIDAGADHSAVRELRREYSTEDAGDGEIAEAILLQGVCERGAETPRFGNTAIRSRLEESQGGDSSTGQGVSGVREEPRTERRGSPCPSPETISVRGNQPAKQLDRAMRSMSPPDRGNDDAGIGLDPDRRAPRRIMFDDLGGRQEALARICSWCGRPDRDWLASLAPLGTALKPAAEHWILARKPLDGTVAENVLEHDTGGLNIDDCRIGFAGAADEEESKKKNQHSDFGSGPMTNQVFGKFSKDRENYNPTGRWPANVTLSHLDDCHDGCAPDCAIAVLDAQSGIARSGVSKKEHGAYEGESATGFLRGRSTPQNQHADVGGASRFFYVAKSSRSEREAGCSHLPARTGAQAVDREEGSAGTKSPRAGAGRTATEVRNHHPTVKPIELMRWLIRLVTPPGGLVLDPFGGSGTTGCAAALEGASCLMIEREPEYAAIAEARVAHWRDVAARGAEKEVPRQIEMGLK